MIGLYVGVSRRAEAFGSSRRSAHAEDGGYLSAALIDGRSSRVFVDILVGRYLVLFFCFREYQNTDLVNTCKLNERGKGIMHRAHQRLVQLATKSMEVSIIEPIEEVARQISHAIAVNGFPQI